MKSDEAACVVDPRNEDVTKRTEELPKIICFPGGGESDVEDVITIWSQIRSSKIEIRKVEGFHEKYLIIRWTSQRTVTILASLISKLFNKSFSESLGDARPVVMSGSLSCFALSKCMQIRRFAKHFTDVLVKQLHFTLD